MTGPGSRAHRTVDGWMDGWMGGWVDALLFLFPRRRRRQKGRLSLSPSFPLPPPRAASLTREGLRWLNLAAARFWAGLGRGGERGGAGRGGTGWGRAMARSWLSIQQGAVGWFVFVFFFVPGKGEKECGVSRLYCCCAMLRTRVL